MIRLITLIHRGGFPVQIYEMKVGNIPKTKNGIVNHQLLFDDVLDGCKLGSYDEQAMHHVLRLVSSGTVPCVSGDVPVNEGHVFNMGILQNQQDPTPKLTHSQPISHYKMGIQQNQQEPTHKFTHSQPISHISTSPSVLQGQPNHCHSYSRPLTGLNSTSDEESYSRFKTYVGRFNSGLLCQLQSKSHPQQQARPVPELTAGQYLNALDGPELEFLKDAEETVLPVDEKWPFLLRFPIGCFGICMGLGSQTVLWKTLSTAATMQFLFVSEKISFTLWCLALMTLVTVFATYMLKCFFYFEAVRHEFHHPVRMNFFFTPWIAGMFLTLGVPPAISVSINPILWICFMLPIFILELKIYGIWLFGGEKRLSRIANPSTHLSLVGNFVGAILAVTVGWREFAIFFWAVGLAHYLVLFVTLYQRLPTATILPKELHPVFFMFIAVPSTASVAWSKIVGDFDLVARITYFMGLFLYLSLLVRINFFRGFRFSVTWWAYTFPMTASAIATIHYSLKVKHPITQGLAILLSLISSVTVLSLFFFTTLRIIFCSTLFPNDMAIAITDGSSKHKWKIKELEETLTPSDMVQVVCVKIGKPVVA